MSNDFIRNAGKNIQQVAKDGANAIGQGAHALGEGAQKAGTVAAESIQHAACTAQQVGLNAIDSVSARFSQTISPEQMQELLDTCYAKTLDGIPGVSQPIDSIVQDYLSHNDSPEAAAKALIANQLVKCTTSGALSAAAGFLTLPVTLAAIPANIANVLYVQIRMITALAEIGGYDIKTDQVQTFVYACLAGSAATDLLKDTGITLGTKFAMAAVKKIPGSVLTSINQKVGFRLATKMGSTGVINLGKLVPFVGVVIGGAFDYFTTKVIADNAYKLFIDASVSNVIEVENLAPEEAEKRFAKDEAKVEAVNKKVEEEIKKTESQKSHCDN